MKLQVSERNFKEFELIKLQGTSQYGIVYREEDNVPRGTTYTIKPLNISKYWLFRKIQLLILKYSFK